MVFSGKNFQIQFLWNFFCGRTFRNLQNLTVKLSLFPLQRANTLHEKDFVNMEPVKRWILLLLSVIFMLNLQIQHQQFVFYRVLNECWLNELTTFLFLKWQKTSPFAISLDCTETSQILVWTTLSWPQYLRIFWTAVANEEKYIWYSFAYALPPACEKRHQIQKCNSSWKSVGYKYRLISPGSW